MLFSRIRGLLPGPPDQERVGAVDLTPWKYRHVVSIVGLILAVAIYVVFSPLGIAA